jgi:hypothetical protein
MNEEKNQERIDAALERMHMEMDRAAEDNEEAYWAWVEACEAAYGPNEGGQ